MTSLLLSLSIRENDILRDFINLLCESIWYSLSNQKSRFVDLALWADFLSLNLVRFFIEILCKLLEDIDS